MGSATAPLVMHLFSPPRAQNAFTPRTSTKIGTQDRPQLQPHVAGWPEYMKRVHIGLCPKMQPRYERGVASHDWWTVGVSYGGGGVGDDDDDGGGDGDGGSGHINGQTDDVQYALTLPGLSCVYGWVHRRWIAAAAQIRFDLDFTGHTPTQTTRSRCNCDRHQ
jgi:hypothetical protein